MVIFIQPFSGLGSDHIAAFTPDCIRGYSQLTASRLPVRLQAFLKPGNHIKNPEGD